MSTTNFYKPLESLVNVILTGDEKNPQGEHPIQLDGEFLSSISNPADDSFNLCFLDRIHKFLENRGESDRVDLVKVFYDNVDLLAGAFIWTVLTNKNHKINQEISMDQNKIMFDYVSVGTAHLALSLTLYFYVENLAGLNISNDTISIDTYNKAIFENSIKRDMESVISFQ
ncbi:MAG: hypothetical protein ACOH1O_10540 [Flavobacterium sp.]